MFWQLATMAAITVGTYVGPTYFGVPFNIYSSDPMTRMEQMMIDRENMWQMREEWRRGGWLKDDPSGFTPYRIHGGVGPTSPDI